MHAATPLIFAIECTWMTPLAVVEDFDVFLDGRFRVCPRGIPLMMDHFVLQAPPEALHRRVVVAVPLARHGCPHAELRDQFPIVVSAILAASVRVENQPWRRPLSANSPPQRLRCQFLRHARAERVAEYRSALLAEGVYPLAMIWHTDYWSTITNMLQDAVRRRRPEGILDKTKDFLLDRLDDMLEPIARSLTGKASWSEMKENAIGASNKEGGLRLVLDHIIALKNKWPDLEIHIVAHSAGSILFAPLIQLLTGADRIATGPMRGSRGAGLKVKTCTLWAPAITSELFKETYQPEIGKGIEQFAMYSLTDTAEQDDNCARIYNKSLLYLVSNAFENERRIPGFKEGTLI